MEKDELLHRISNRLVYPMTILWKGVELGGYCKEAMEKIREMLEELKMEKEDEDINNRPV
ncbi:MAG: hypothetical protein HYS08_02885 [Chlamydiae bacterium]|nr:hypothetical protein [Chlamydiota bacterium]MBI3266947.1 hypothetical protein [Chlamydiota bacterium]